MVSIRLIRDGKVLAERKLLETSFDYHEITRAVFSAASNGGIVMADQAFWWFFLRNPEMLKGCMLEFVGNGRKIRLRIVDRAAEAKRAEEILR